MVGPVSQLMAEDLLLLLLDDESGRMTRAMFLEAGLGGALLVELALGGFIEVRARDRWWAKAVVRRAGHGEPEDPALGDALSRVEERERRAQDLVPWLGKGLREPLLERLASSGVLRRQDDKVLGLFPRPCWFVVDSARERELRRALGDVLLRGAEADPRTAGLVAVLSALDLAHGIVDREGASSREVRARAKQVAEGAWATQGVKDAVVAAQGAMVAMMAATAVATSLS